MRYVCLTIAAALLAATDVYAEEIPLSSPIESIALFKNGLAAVRRSAEIAGPGVYRIDDVPAPVHGTFWIEGDIAVDAQVTMREVDAPQRPTIDLQQELVGRAVTIHFKQGGIPAASGKVLALEKPSGDAAWSRTYERPSDRYYYGGEPPPAGGSSNFLVLESGRGRTFVDPSEIAFLECDDAKPTTRQRVPTLLLTPHGDKKGSIHVSYLTRGIAWAPSYRVNLVDDKSLTVEQQAVVKNELADMKDAEMTLISGYPSVQFSHVVSPLALSQNWTEFFNQINRDPAEYASAAGNIVAQNAAPPSGADAGGVDLAAPPSGEGVDLHYQSIGKRTMEEGDSLMVSVGTAPATYERIVEWIVPDTRDEEGRFRDREQYGRRTAENDQDQPWDAVKFKNPLAFPMTTAPAMIEDHGHFAGQRLSYWVNSGEETTLQITKALSVRTRAIEHETPNSERQLENIGGREYRRVSVSGDLTISNHRDQEIHLVIHRQFSGELTKSDGSPQLTLREEGVYSVNRRNELTWTLPLKAGEEKTLHYEYTVLVMN